MKKVKFLKKLSLNKETIAKLNTEQMNQVNGGFTIINTAAGGACKTYQKSCFDHCGSWINCAATA